MKAHLIIEYDDFDGTWVVEVVDRAGACFFYNRTAFKFTAWISYFIWKYINRRFELDKDIDKWIEL